MSLCYSGQVSSVLPELGPDGVRGSTGIDPKEDRRLFKKWHKSEIWPRTAEQETTLSSSGREPHTFVRFCPEGMYDRFEWFATSLAAFPDELDRDFAQASLRHQNADAEDWRWVWWQMTAMHYSECPLYSIISRPATTESQPDILSLKPGMWGLTVDLKAIWMRLRSWF